MAVGRPAERVDGTRVVMHRHEAPRPVGQPGLAYGGRIPSSGIT